MSFWRYAEKVSGFVGLPIVLDHIRVVYQQWEANETVETCVEVLKRAKGPKGD